MRTLRELHIERPQVCQRATLCVKAKMCVSLVNFLVAMAADLSPHICRHIGIRQLGNECVTQRMKSERFELTTFALLLNAAIGVNASCGHNTLKHPRKPTISPGALGRERWAKFRCWIVTARQR